MTKQEAKQSLCMLSCGTLGTLTGLRKYSEIDNILFSWLDKIDNLDVTNCKNWNDVYNLVK
jgi:hypothetical protein